MINLIKKSKILILSGIISYLKKNKIKNKIKIYAKFMFRFLDLCSLLSF
jgi:hypothetical protein